MPFLLMFASAINAAEMPKNVVDTPRQKVVKEYLNYLHQHDVKISTLFTPDGIVVSTTQGKRNAKAFFDSLFPQIDSSNLKLHKTFKADDDPNALGARFHLALRMKSGDTSQGEYVDEFVFEASSDKLTAVYMFENLKF